MLPDEPTDEERLQELPEDHETPFRPADPTRNPDTEADDDSQPQKPLDDTHPSTDSNIQREELYDEGISGAAEATEPNAGDNVAKYDTPPKD